MTLRPGRQRIRVTLWRSPQGPDDADGFFEPLDPLVWWIQLAPLVPSENERTITSMVSMRYHPQVTVDTRIVRGDDPTDPGVRQLLVMGVQHVDEVGAELRCLCQEITP